MVYIATVCIIRLVCSYHRLYHFYVASEEEIVHFDEVSTQNSPLSMANQL